MVAGANSIKTLHHSIALRWNPSISCPQSSFWSPVNSRCCSRGIYSHYSCSALASSSPRGATNLETGRICINLTIKDLTQSALKEEGCSCEAAVGEPDIIMQGPFKKQRSLVCTARSHEQPSRVSQDGFIPK